MGCPTRRTHGVLFNPRILGILLVAFWVAFPISTVWAQAEVYLYVVVTNSPQLALHTLGYVPLPNRPILRHFFP